MMADKHTIGDCIMALELAKTMAAMDVIDCIDSKYGDTDVDFWLIDEAINRLSELVIELAGN